MPPRRSALVTGGAGAIGGAIVEALSADHAVTVVDRAGAEPLDLADEQATREFARRTTAASGGCDVFVHAAASFEQADLATLTSALWRRVQAVNVESALWLCQEVVPAMCTAGRGRIVFVVSDTVWQPPTPALLPYVASKAALIGAARTLARDLGRHGITVNCVAPGLTETPAARAGAPAEAFAAVQAAQAVPRPLVPEDVAGAVAYLASDAASAVTGQTLNVDGGLVLR